MRGKIFLWHKVPLLGEVWSAVPSCHWVHSTALRNHTLLVFVCGITCFPPSCSSAPTRVPLPVAKEMSGHWRIFRTPEEQQSSSATVYVQKQARQQTFDLNISHGPGNECRWAGEKCPFFVEPLTWWIRYVIWCLRRCCPVGCSPRLCRIKGHGMKWEEG